MLKIKYYKAYSLITQCILLMIFVLTCFQNLLGQTDPSASFGNTFIHSEGNITVYGDHQFRLPNESNTAQPGIIGGERAPTLGYFNFAPGATWVEADSAKYVDGYVRHFGNTKFLFPIGDNNSYRPAAVSGGAYVEASYFAVDPTLAITSDIRGGNFPVLPLSGPFDSQIYNDAIIKVSEYEYWDINGADPTIITLTWDENSNVDVITTMDLERLAIVGWNGAQWEYIPSYIDFASISLDDYSAVFDGPVPEYERGSISTKIPIVPSSYEVYTLASSCLSMDLDVSNEVLICMGDSITLNASSFEEAEITWSTGAIGPSIMEAPDENTLYTVTASLGACEVTREIFVEVREMTVELGQDTFVCSGNDITLVANANYPGSYQWEHRGVLTFGNNSITLQNLNTPSTLNVTVTDSNGCSAIDSVFIDIRQSPDVFTGRDASVCLGDSTFIQAFGSESGYGYQWSTGDTSSLIFVSPMQNTTYEVSLTENGCSDVSFVTVEVFPQAYIEITNDSIICPGEEITIETESSIGSYLWSTGDSTESIIVSPLDGETYSVTLTSPGNCEWMDEITFSSFENTLDAGEDIFMCEGETVNLEIEGIFDSVLWDNGSTSEQISVSPNVTTTYEVTSFFGECSVTTEVVVNVNNVLTVDLGPDVTICQGDSIELSSNSVGQYNWSTGENSNNITVSPFTTSNYTVTVTSGGCVDEDDITVNVIEDPAFVEITTSELFCPGQQVFIQTIGSPGNYIWNNGNTSPAFLSTPVDGEIYAVTVTNSSGCSASDQIVFNAYDQGNIELGPDIDLCIGESVQLQVEGVYESLYWSNGSTNDFITISPLASDYYYVTATLNGCESYDSIYVNVIDVLSLELGENITICSGESIELSINNVVGNFEWSTGQTGNSITLTPSSTASYSVTVTSGDCSSSDEISIIVDDPFIEILANPNYCPGESLVLNTNASPGTIIWNNGITAPSIEVFPSPGFSYSATVVSPEGCTSTDVIMPTPLDLSNVNLGDDMDICEGASVTLNIEGDYDLISWSNGSISNSITVTPLVSTDYSVTVTEGGCTVSDTVSISVVEAVVLDLGPDILICQGEATVLSSNAIGTYEWSTGETTSSITVNPLQTTSYYLTLTSGLCSTEDSIQVIIEPEPNVVISGETTICPGDQTTLTASGTPGLYQWNNGLFGNQITVSPNPGQTYSVTVTTPNGCTSSAEVTIDAFNVSSIELGENKVICPGETVDLQVVGNYDQILWSTGEDTAIISVSPTQTTNYTVTAWIGSCQVSDQILVIVDNNINLDLGPDITLCYGQSVELGSNIVGTYLWSTGETTNTITVSPEHTTTYQAYVESGNCNSLDEITIFIEYQAYVNITTGEYFCQGETILLETEGSLGSYEWSTGQIGPNITVNPLNGSTYYVTVTTPDGCIGTDSIQLLEYANQSLFIGEDIYICEGEEVSLQINAPYVSLNWEDGSSDNPRLVQPTTTTTYSATATFRSCSNTDEITVHVSSSIDLDLGDDYNICKGNTVNIGSSSINGDYLWNTGETSQFISVSPDSSTQFHLIVNSGNCTAEDSIWVNVDEVNVEILNDPVFCDGEVITLLTESTENSYLWSTGETTSSIDVEPESNATYSVTVTNPNDCSHSDQITLTQYGGGDVLLGPDITICPGGFVTLRVRGTFDYVIWGDGFQGHTRVVSPGNTTTYSITAAYGSCFAFDQITVFVEEQLDLDLGPDITICPGQSVELSDPTVGGVYDWSTGETTNTIIVSPVNTTLYTVTVSSGICVAQDEISVIVSEDCMTDLSVIKTSNNFSPSIGDTIELSVLIANDGDISATNIEVNEIIRSGFDLISYEASYGDYNINTSTWYLDELEVDSSELLQLTVEVLGTGDYFNIVEIMKSDQLDIDSEPGNGNETEDDFDKITLDVQVIEEIIDTTSEIGDRVWLDENGDGFQAFDEEGIESVEVQLFSAGDFTTPLEIQFTDALGNFCFTGLSSGAYFVKFIVPNDMVITKPKFAGANSSFDDQDSDIENIYGLGTTGMIYLGIDEQIKTCDGGFYPGGSIGDLVWEDALGGLDDRYDQSIDSGVEGITMRLYDFNMDTMINEMVTDVNGYYMFTNLAQGDYYVEIVLPSYMQHMDLVSPNAAIEDIDSDFDPFSYKTPSISLSASEVKDYIDAGLSGSLPLTLLDFWGERIYDDELNRLFWSTEMEINTDRFEIERSLSSNFDFQYIGEVEAAGNSSETLYYTFDDLDSRSAGEYYYRLKMIDLNGQYNYSNVIVIRVNDGSVNEDEDISYKIFPIPTTDYLKLEISVHTDNIFEGFLVNNLGQHVRTFNRREISEGINLLNIDVIDLAQGQYYLNFFIGEEQFIAKVLILD